MLLSSFRRVSWAALVAAGLLAGCGDDSGSNSGAAGPGGPGSGGSGGAGTGGTGTGGTGDEGGAPPIPQTFWSERFGDNADQWSAGVAVDGWGQIYTAGTFDGTLDLGASADLGPVNNAIFAAHFDSTGQPVWGKAFDGDDLVEAMSVATDSVGNTFLSGGFFGSLDFGGGVSVVTNPSVSESSLFVAKLDPTGNAVWAKKFGVWTPSGDIGRADVAVDANGRASVAGWLEGTAQLGATTLTSAGGVDVLVAKFDAVGPTVWAKNFGDELDQIPEGVATDTAGNVVVAGRFEGELNFGGGVLPQTSGGMFIAKLGAADGAHIWSKGFAFTPQDTLYPHGTLVAGTTIDPTGNVLVWGRLAGTLSLGTTQLTSTPGSSPDGHPLYDMFVVKLDPSGTVLWGKRFGDNQSQGGLRALRVDPMGNLVLAGGLTGTVDFGGGTPLTASGPSDAFVAKLSASGSFISAQQYGDADAQSASGLAVYGNGIVLSGDLQGTADFGYGPLHSAGERDALLVRLPAP